MLSNNQALQKRITLPFFYLWDQLLGYSAREGGRIPSASVCPIPNFNKEEFHKETFGANGFSIYTFMTATVRKLKALHQYDFRLCVQPCAHRNM